MWRVAPFEFPSLAYHFAVPLWNHKDRCHAERVRYFEVPRQVLKHRRSFRIDVVMLQEALVHLRQRFGVEIGRCDVEHVLEMPVDFEPSHHSISVLARSIGQDQLAARQALERFAKTIARWPEVLECYLMTGPRDYWLRVVVPDLAAYEQFLKQKLTRLEGVASIESSFALEQVKYTNVLPVL